MRTTAVTFLALLLIFAAACGAEGDAPPSAAAEPEAPLPSADSNTWREAAEERLRAQFDDVYERYLATLAEPHALRHVLINEADGLRMYRRTFIAHLYAAREWAPLFVRPDGRLHERAEALLDALSTAEDYALDPTHFLTREGLEDAIAAQRELAVADAAFPAVRPSGDQWDAFTSALDAPEARTANDPLLYAVRTAFESSVDGLEPLVTHHDERVEVRRALVGNAAVVEGHLADAMLAWAFEQRHFNPGWYPDGLSDDELHTAIAEAMRETFTAMAAANTRDAADAVMEGILPHHDQYAKLVAERARYAEIVAAGGWATIDPTHLERGSSGATVRALQERLAAEGYFEGEVDGVFGDELEQAVRHYQQTHQMEVTGESSRGFWFSINISAEDRLAQIELTLQRWRESRVGSDTYYVHVNVPDFHAEIWNEGRRDMRFGIVVGNTDRVCDPRTGQWKYANATPMQTASMTYVVMNPYWNVPSRIVDEELLPNLLENPLYFEEMGFERVVRPDGYEAVRQLPGPENPLGRVKFMFPNPHNTYMHDTSRPQYFRYPVRAFSHGCMRVSEPMEMLEYVLTQDEQWEDRRIERIYEGSEETTVSLRRAIPVHIEYFVVRVDDEGWANFLADIYRYDRDRLSPPSAQELSCIPEVETEWELVLGENSQPMYRGPDGVMLTPDEWEYVQEGGTLTPEGTVPVGAAEGSGAPGLTPPPAPSLEGDTAPSTVTAGDLGP